MKKNLLLDAFSNFWVLAFILVGTSVQAQLFYRSNQTGNWNATSTWQSSPDGSSWSAATGTPSSSDNAITIRAGHTVTINSTVTLDETTIEATGELVYSGGSLTISNGPGDDLIIFGKYRHDLNAGAPYVTGSAIRVKTNGTLEVNNNSTSASHYGLSNQIFYENGSTYYWNVSSGALFLSSGVTYFPNSSAGEIPTFRVNTPNINVGAGSTTTINGIFQVDANTVTWLNNGTKIFRNGITGSGTVTQAANSGAFQITSTASSIAPGTLNLNAGGLTITGTAEVDLDGSENINGGTVTVDGRLFCGSHIITGTGNFSLSTNGILGIGSTNGITSGGPSGNIQLTGFRSFGTGANYVYNGTSPQVTGSGLPATVAGLTINNSSGVELTNTVSVSNTLTMTAGKLDLIGRNLTINNVAGPVWGSTTSSYVIATNGLVIRTNPTSTIFPIGTAGDYMPCRVTGGGTFNINLSTTVPGLEPSLSLANQWNFDGAGSINVDFQWPLAVEGSNVAINRSNLYLYKHTGTWANIAGPVSGSGGNPYTASFTGISCCSGLTIGALNALLPVELAWFRAALLDKTTLLTWRTLSESNSDLFQIQRSPDDRTFQSIGEVAAAGFSTQTLDYQFTDTAPLPGTNYYRLQQFDFDGTSSFSPVITVEYAPEGSVTVFPNPARDRLHLTFGEETTELTVAYLFDPLGRQIAAHKIQVGTTSHEMDLHAVLPGNYWVKIQSGPRVETVRVVKISNE